MWRAARAYRARADDRRASALAAATYIPMLTGEIRNLIAERRIVPVVVLSVPQETTPPAHQATMGNDTTYTRMIAEEAIPWEQVNWRITGTPAKIVPLRS